jgi:hypothetical protein
MFAVRLRRHDLFHSVEQAVRAFSGKAESGLNGTK